MFTGYRYTNVSDRYSVHRNIDVLNISKPKFKYLL